MKWTKLAQNYLQTFIVVLTGIFFVWIIIFGYNQLHSVNETISNQDKLDLKNKLKDALEYCQDPLNIGSKKVFKFDSKYFNGVCIEGVDSFNPSEYGSLGIELNKLNGTNKNVYLIKGNFIYNQTINKYLIKDYSIVDSFNADFKELPNSFCSFEKFEITC